MATDISAHFDTLFPSRIFVDFQKLTALLRSTVTVQPVMGAVDVKFKRKGIFGSGVKARNGDVPIFDTAHSTVSCTVSDLYSTSLIDDMDKFKTNGNEQQTNAEGHAAELARKSDGVVLTALDAATTVMNQTAGVVDGEFTYVLWQSLLRTFMTRNVPLGGITMVVGPEQRMQFDRFVSAGGGAFPITVSGDFNNGKPLQSDPSMGVTWQSINVITTTGLPAGVDGGGAFTKCFAYHRDAVGLALQESPNLMYDRVPLKDATLITARMAMGSVIIQDAGVVEFDCRNT